MIAGVALFLFLLVALIACAVGAGVILTLLYSIAPWLPFALVAAILVIIVGAKLDKEI